MYKENKAMKITKEQLKQIIKEELENLIAEGSDWYSDEYETLADKKFADSQRDMGHELNKSRVEFPELPRHELLAKELTQAYNSDEAGFIGTAPNFVGIEHYMSDRSIMQMEDYAFKLQSKDFPPHITNWIYAFHDVIKGYE